MANINYFEPNGCNNEIPSNEDISIYVNLETTTKGKSLIMVDNIEGESIISSGGKTTTLKFLDSTKNSNNSLTTSYTDVTSLLGDEEELETLGIESIDIDFDTAFTPLIKIKFIDLRATSILGKGNESKYKMFFDLPYPIFSLTVKGHYGKPVKYCLHLLKWNAKFNSKTGNFEIETEFIGYTYAILTDLLLGYMRAVVLTEKGSKKFDEQREIHANKGITLLSINELLDVIGKLDDEFDSIKNDDKNITNIANIEKTQAGIELIRNDYQVLERTLVPPSNNYFYDSGIVTVPNAPTTINYEDVISKFNDKTKINIETYNELLKLASVSFEFKDHKEIINEPYGDFIGLTPQIKENLHKTLVYSRDTDDTTNLGVTNLANIMGGNLDTDDGCNINIYDFRELLAELDRVEFLLKENIESLREEIAKKVLELSISKLRFNPTIRNIFRTFTVHCEILLETIKDVSKDAESSTIRKDILVNKLTKDNIDDHAEETIFPWPEVRRKVKKGENFEESWIGENFTLNEKQGVDEIKFVEDLLSQLMVISKQDTEAILSRDYGGEQYYPISPLDTIFMNDSNINPYNTSVFGDEATGKPNEAIRCMLMRGFLGLGVSNTKYPDALIRMMGTMEAYNLSNAINIKLSNTDGQILMDEIIQKENGLIDTWKTGVDNIKHPRGVKVKGLLSEFGGNYNYNYIDDVNSNRVFLPINGSFNGGLFYNGDTLKSNSELQSLDINFTSNNFGTEQNVNNYNDELDGSNYFRILTSGEYNGESINPTYGSEYISEDYANIIKNNRVIQQGSLAPSLYDPEREDGVNKKTANQMIGLNPLSYNLFVEEVTNMVYNVGVPTVNSPGSELTYNSDKVSTASILCSYWRETYLNAGGGSFLAYYDVNGNNEAFIDGEFQFIDKFRTLSISRRFPNRSLTNTGTIESDVNSDGLYYPNNSIKQYGKQRKLLGDLLGQTINANKNEIYMPFIEFNVISNSIGESTHKYYSLFGSEFYYNQGDEGKAFLFLHSLSWHGLTGRNVGDEVSLFDTIQNNGSERDFGDEETPTIKGIFKNNAAFIRAPKLWCAFIGGLLYRHRETIDIISYTNSNGEPILPEQDSTSYTPSKTKFLFCNDDSIITEQTNMGISFDFTNGTDDYHSIDDTILNLPKQVKDEFITIFENFVNDSETGYDNIKEGLELFTSVDDLRSKWDTLEPDIIENPDSENETTKYYLKKSNIESTFSSETEILKNYVNITPIELDDDIKHFDLTMRPGTSVSKIINNNIKGEYVILNGSPKTFRDSDSPIPLYDNLSVNKEQYQLYVDNFYLTFKKLFKEKQDNSETDNNEIQKDIFNSIDDDMIKLNIYRTIGSIYTKWIAGSDTILNQCGNTSESLLDTFKFLDRAFNDIGDDFYINPFAIDFLVRGNLNTSFFDFVNRVLADNNFNFIALPTFLDFTKEEDLKSMFTPYSYNDLDEADFNSGPSFICTYAGQASTNLDLGNNPNYKDDGIVIELGDDCKPSSADIPSDFINVPMVGVSYGKQNQSIFKDLTLDQTEFSETSESLQIIEDISQSGDKRKSTFVGQNLFNVYQTRSYSAEVEMMGCAMMQPMIYFHLNNIPMFRGAYMILKVTHRITANNMTTKFKGVRVKRTKTPLIDAVTLFMNLLGSFNTNEDKEKITRTSTKSTIDIIPTINEKNIVIEGIIIED